jgi:prepilin-type N-terminal cleavage/methylation domain-containing protein
LKRSEDGFTFIEIMIALVIFSILGVIVWQAISHGSKLLDKISITSSKVVEVLDLDRTLRKYTAEIIIPFWIAEINIKERDNEIEIPFYKGDEHSYLCFQCKGEYLLVGCHEGNGEHTKILHTFGPYVNAKAEKAYNTAGECIGLTFTVNQKKSGDLPIVITAGFRSNPFIKQAF